MRYKPPQRYKLAKSLKRKRVLNEDGALEELRDLLVHNEK